MPVCVSELRYVGHADLMKDLDNFTEVVACMDRGSYPVGEARSWQPIR
jgi:hypothetical protein